MRKLSIALALVAAMGSSVASVSSRHMIRRREQIGNPLQGKIPKQKAQFGKPPKKLHNRGIGNGPGRKGR